MLTSPALSADGHLLGQDVHFANCSLIQVEHKIQSSDGPLQLQLAMVSSNAQPPLQFIVVSIVTHSHTPTKTLWCK